MEKDYLDSAVSRHESKMNLATSEWIYWLSGILAGAFASYLFGVEEYSWQLSLLRSIVGSSVGGIIVGYMPCIGRRLRFTKIGWLLWILICLVIVISASPNIRKYIFYNSDDVRDVAFYNKIIFIEPVAYEVPLGIITGSSVAFYTRGICNQWALSTTNKRKWLIARALMIAIVIAHFLIYFLFAVFIFGT